MTLFKSHYIAHFSCLTQLFTITLPHSIILLGKSESKTLIHVFLLALQVVPNNLNPRWKTTHIPVQQLCNGDYDRVIKVNTCFLCM